LTERLDSVLRKLQFGYVQKAALTAFALGTVPLETKGRRRSRSATVAFVDDDERNVR
jgi:hypothetical protein